MKTENRSSLGS